MRIINFFFLFFVCFYSNNLHAEIFYIDIDKIINQRIEDGQLNECPLTLDELNRIKGTVDGTSGMLRVLRGIYHIRVEYPDEPKSSASA